MKSLDLTLAILKPDVVKVPFVLREIQQRILSAGFYVIQSREVSLKEKDAKNFYAEHEGKFFHNRLVTFMKSGPIQAYVLAHSDAIQLWRNLMGPTKTFRSQYEAPLSIRGSFGLSDTRNSTHGSDSPVSVAREIKFFFPQFDMDSWYERDEPLFRKGMCYFNEKEFTHHITSSSQNSSSV
uniref:Nucleoside diphosphate kinase n=1 Tax=Evadne anonyx TaxID=141404 RepID=A0A9N6WQP9_9CRUS|nr:EOG090X0HUX [Evadne anonyx]